MARAILASALQRLVKRRLRLRLRPKHPGGLAAPLTSPVVVARIELKDDPVPPSSLLDVTFHHASPLFFTWRLRFVV